MDRKVRPRLVNVDHFFRFWVGTPLKCGKASRAADETGSVTSEQARPTWVIGTGKKISVIHVAHAAARGHGRGGVLPGPFGNHGLGGDQERGNSFGQTHRACPMATERPVPRPMVWSPMQLADEQLAIIINRVKKTPEVQAVFLYGSRAKGTAKPDSDVVLALSLRQHGSSRNSSATVVAGEQSLRQHLVLRCSLSGCGAIPPLKQVMSSCGGERERGTRPGGRLPNGQSTSVAKPGPGPAVHWSWVVISMISASP